MKQPRELEADKGAVWSPEFSPDGRTLAAGVLTHKSTGDGAVFLWDVKTLDLLQRLEGHTDQVFDVSFSSDGRILASASGDGTVRLWDLTTGQQIGEPLLGHSDDVHALAFDPAGTDLVSAGADGSVIVWDAGSRLLGGGGPINVVTFAKDGSRLISAEPLSYAETLFPPDPTGGGDVFLWDTTTWTTVGEPIHGEHLSGMMAGPNGEWFVGGTLDGRVLRAEVNGGLSVDDALPTAGDILFPVAVSPDGATIAGGTFRSGVDLWNLSSGDLLRDALPGFEHGVHGLVYGLAFAPDGSTLATGDWSGRVRIWDTDTWEPIQDPLAEGLQRVYAVTFDTTGTRLAAAGLNGSVIVWDTSTWQRIRELTIDDAVLSLAFSPDGQVLAAGTEAGQVQFIDMESGRPIGGPVSGQRDWVNTVAFAPDGETLVAGSEDGSIALIASSAWTDDIAVLAEDLCSVAGRGMTQTEWNEFVAFKPYEAGCPHLGGGP